jgi:hypothetical protein
MPVIAGQKSHRMMYIAGQESHGEIESRWSTRAQAGAELRVKSATQGKPARTEASTSRFIRSPFHAHTCRCGPRTWPASIRSSPPPPRTRPPAPPQAPRPPGRPWPGPHDAPTAPRPDPAGPDGRPRRSRRRRPARRMGARHRTCEILLSLKSPPLLLSL